MSDYQAVYDAVRSRISGGNIGEVVAEQARQAFEISWAVESVRSEFLRSAMEQQRPCVLYRPAISIDGNQWCALYGANLQDGVAGFGDSPFLAMDAFDVAWFAKLAPPHQGSDGSAEEPSSASGQTRRPQEAPSASGSSQ